jgi:hypothetical protein
MKTSELIGPALDWAVAKLEGDLVPTGGVMIQTWPYYSSYWAHGGPIIEREKITLVVYWNGLWVAEPEEAHESVGETPLVAAMRSFVESKLGDEIDIPEELK